MSSRAAAAHALWRTLRRRDAPWRVVERDAPVVLAVGVAVRQAERLVPRVGRRRRAARRELADRAVDRGGERGDAGRASDLLPDQVARRVDVQLRHVAGEEDERPRVPRALRRRLVGGARRHQPRRPAEDERRDGVVRTGTVVGDAEHLARLPRVRRRRRALVVRQHEQLRRARRRVAERRRAQQRRRLSVYPISGSSLRQKKRAPSSSCRRGSTSRSSPRAG